MCNFQQWYIIWTLTSNTYLNAVIAWQLHEMLTASAKRQRFYPPTRFQVMKLSLLVYAFSGLIGCWGFTFGRSSDLAWWPMTSGPLAGLYCVPLAVDSLYGELFLWLVCFPLIQGIPSLYLMYVVYEVYFKRLLPPVGQRRSLVIYFARLIFVFAVMWTPALIIRFIPAIPPWVNWVGGTWGHLQGAVSAAVSLMKDDIFDAVRAFVTCSKEKTDEELRGVDPGGGHLARRRSSMFTSPTYISGLVSNGGDTATSSTLNFSIHNSSFTSPNSMRTLQFPSNSISGRNDLDSSYQTDDKDDSRNDISSISLSLSSRAFSAAAASSTATKPARPRRMLRSATILPDGSACTTRL